MTLHRPSLSILLIAGAALAASGCAGIRCETYSFMRYNAQADSFRCMQLYHNLRTEEKAELDHLKSICDRARLIINPLDGYLWRDALRHRESMRNRLQ